MLFIIHTTGGDRQTHSLNVYHNLFIRFPESLLRLILTLTLEIAVPFRSNLRHPNRSAIQHNHPGTSIPKCDSVAGCQVARRSMASKAPAVWKTQVELAKFCRTTVSDMPIPAGAWRTHYNAQQTRWNRNLALNVGFFLFTIGVVSRLAIAV